MEINILLSLIQKWFTYYVNHFVFILFALMLQWDEAGAPVMPLQRFNVVKRVCRAAHFSVVKR